MTNPIAIRTFQIAGYADRKIEMKIFAPHEVDGNWRCLWQVTGKDKVYESIEAGGADSYQALCGAIVMSAAYFRHSSELPRPLKLYEDSDSLYLDLFDGYEAATKKSDEGGK